MPPSSPPHPLLPPLPSPFRVLGRFADGSYINRAACDAAFDRMHRRDRIGDHIHLVFACLGLFLVSGPVTVTELAFAPLLVFFVVRVVNTGPLWIHGFGQPTVLVAVALMVWGCVSLAWSPDIARGLNEIGRLRWLVLLGLVFPVIERRGALVTALAFGLIVAGIAQLLSGLEPFRGLFPARHPGRVTGWWDPVVAGSVQCGAVGLFLFPALRGQGWARWIGVIGLAVALAGVLASGTRGAWIASAILLVIGVPLAVMGERRGASAMEVAGSNPVTLASRKRAWQRLGLGGVLVLGVIGMLGGVAVTQREGLWIRVEQARQELAAAATGDLDTPTGARVAVMAFALESGLRRPWGLGAGGIGGGEEGNSHLPPATDSKWQVPSPKSQVASGKSHALPHAHSAPLHLFGTLGWIGLGLGGLWAWVALRNAGGGRGGEPDQTGGLLGGLPLGIAGLLLAGLFDAVQINTQTCALLGAMAALSPAYWVGRHPMPTLPKASEA